MIVGNQGFDCVIKGFRIGRQARRPSWAEGVVLTYDAQEGQIFLLGPEPWGMQVWNPGNDEQPTQVLSVDLMATDWEIYAL